MIAFRYLSFIGLVALCFTSSTKSASILDPRQEAWDFQAQGDAEVSISVFIDQFIKLSFDQQISILYYFQNNERPYGFTWHECIPFLPPWFRLPGCPPPPPEGCPIPPQGCRPPPPQWYCPKHKKPESAKNCPKPPPKPPICSPWQKGFYHLKPEDEHI